MEKKPSDKINDIYSRLVTQALLTSRNKAIDKLAIRVYAIEEHLDEVERKLNEAKQEMDKAEMMVSKLVGDG